MSEEVKEQKFPNRRYVAKVRNQKGQYGDFQKVLIDNPDPVNGDGTPNTYHKGILIWCDNETGKKYLVKSMSVRGAPKSSLSKGFTSSISIDLDNEYEVQDLG